MAQVKNTPGMVNSNAKLHYYVKLPNVDIVALFCFIQIHIGESDKTTLLVQHTTYTYAWHITCYCKDLKKIRKAKDQGNIQLLAFLKYLSCRLVILSSTFLRKSVSRVIIILNSLTSLL